MLWDPLDPLYHRPEQTETSGHACNHGYNIRDLHARDGFRHQLPRIRSYFNNVPLMNDETEHCIKPSQNARDKPRFPAARWEPC
jgi:hypothetical protein